MLTALPSFSLSEIIARFGGELLGADVSISKVAPIERASANELAFIASPKFLTKLANSAAAAIIVPPSLADKDLRPRIVVADPYLYFARVSGFLNPQPRPSAGVHSSAIISDSAVVSTGASIGASVVIGERSIIADGVVLHPGVVIGNDVQIGANSVLYPHVTIADRCILGERVIVHPSAVIGSDGFGNAWTGSSWEKIPQIGSVRIGNDVEIGASTTIDRGTLDDTIIEDGVRLDNQIQIAHNVYIGKHTAMAGCVGVAGSTKIGAHCTFGGSAMILGHLEIADRVNVMAGTLVGKSIRKSGTYTGWYPVQPHEDWLQNASHLRHLDALVTRVKELEKKLATIERAPDGDNL